MHSSHLTRDKKGRPGQREGAEILTDTNVSIDAGIAGGSGQVLVLAVRDVQLGARVAVSFRQTEVDDVHQVPPFPQSHQKVVRFNVPVDEVTGVDEFDPADLLVQPRNFVVVIVVVQARVTVTMVTGIAMSVTDQRKSRKDRVSENAAQVT